MIPLALTFRIQTLDFSYSKLPFDFLLAPILCKPALTENIEDPCSMRGARRSNKFIGVLEREKKRHLDVKKKKEEMKKQKLEGFQMDAGGGSRFIFIPRFVRRRLLVLQNRTLEVHLPSAN